MSAEWPIRVVQTCLHLTYDFFISEPLKRRDWAVSRRHINLSEGGRTHLLLAVVYWPFTTHSFRDGAPFLLLLLETPPTFWAPTTFFPHILHNLRNRANV